MVINSSKPEKMINTNFSHCQMKETYYTFLFNLQKQRHFLKIVIFVQKISYRYLFVPIKQIPLKKSYKKIKVVIENYLCCFSINGHINDNAMLVGNKCGAEGHA